MVTTQRRRGQQALVYKLKTIVDGRGNRRIVLDRDNPTPVRAAFIPQRSSRAEIPGQQTVDVTRMLVDADTPDVDVWNVVVHQGVEWDIVAPPAYHDGPRRVRHLSVDIRRKPADPPAVTGG